MKKIWKISKELFSGWMIVLYLLILLGLNTGYHYLISNNIVTSLTAGVIGSLVCFVIFVIWDKRVKDYQLTLKELNKYATTVNFLLKSGKNVLYALEGAYEVASPKIKKDIQKTIKCLKEKGELDVAHFNKYDFASLNIFHQILNIKYLNGGSASDLFRKVNQDMNFEIAERDELHIKKSQKAKQVYVMLGMAGMMPVVISFVAKTTYSQFLENTLVSSFLCFLLHMAVLLTLFYLQKEKKDISIKI